MDLKLFFKNNHKLLLFVESYHRYDKFGTNDPKYIYSDTINISLVFSFKYGIFFRVSSKDATFNGGLFKSIFKLIQYYDTNSPGYYRLEETLHRKGLWKYLD